MTRNIFIAIATITFVVLVCINLFSPEQPSDYSYLKTFPESEKLELSENVVVENIDDLYYDYDTDFQGNVTTVYIHDKFSGGYGDGKFIFSYNGMRLDFDYEVKIFELGTSNVHGKDDTATVFEVISTDGDITGSIFVTMGTWDMLNQKEAHSGFTAFSVAAVITSFVLSLLCCLVEALFYANETLFSFNDQSADYKYDEGALYAVYDKKTSSFVYKSYDEIKKSTVYLRIKNHIGASIDYLEINIKRVIVNLVLWYMILSGILCAITTFLFGSITGGAWFFVIPLLIFVAGEIIAYKISDGSIDL